jgi:hypothetical protein
MRSITRLVRLSAGAGLLSICAVAALAMGARAYQGDSAGSGFPLRVPTGSYMRTCSYCQFDSRTQYSCKCRRIDDRVQATRIDLTTCKKVDGFEVLSNQDGNLRCR